MLEITIPKQDLWDEAKEEFVVVKETKFLLEHSLISLSKWESETHKIFLDKKEKTREEILTYIRCMVVGNIPDPNIFNYIPDNVISQVSAYIDDSHTATFFDGSGSKGNNYSEKKVTSELIYFQMIQCGIPPQYEKWHLNRLLTLIRVCKEETQPKKKMSKAELIAHHRALNQQRRAKAKMGGK